MPSSGTASSKASLGARGVPASVTEAGPPENMMPRGAKAPGWETSVSFLIWIVKLPWATATVEMRSWLPSTTVPVRSLMITRAGASTLRVSASRRAMNSISLGCSGGGTATATVDGSTALARVPRPAPLTAWASRTAVVKSDCWSTSTTEAGSSAAGTSRSTTAPFGTRPTVGWFFCTVSPPAPDARIPPTPRADSVLIVSMSIMDDPPR